MTACAPVKISAYFSSLAVGAGYLSDRNSMNSRSLGKVTPAFLCALAAGVCIGWFSKSIVASSDVASKAGKNGNATENAQPRNDLSNESFPTKGSRRAEDKVLSASGTRVYLMADIFAIPTTAFAQELSKLIHDSDVTPDSLERQAALLRGMDAEKALATFFEYKKAYMGNLSGFDPKLSSLLQVAGTLDGRGCADKILQASPNGIPEIGGLMHGWAKTQPAEAAEWFNRLPTEYPMFRNALHGVFFGLAETDPAYARKTFASLNRESLRPEDYLVAAESVTSSLISFHSVESAASHIQSLPDDLRTVTLERAMWSFDRRPPGEMVPFLAEYGSQSLPVRQRASTQLRQWAGAEPQAALEWATQFSADNTDPSMGIDFFRTVGKTIEKPLLQEWLKGHSAHPATLAATDILRGEESASQN